MSEDFRQKARPLPKDNHYAVFEVGQVYEHHWARTINAGDNSQFATLMLSCNPVYFNIEYAGAQGHRAVAI